ncbi:uncharacterized protein LOC144453905 [Glandiceps talaboti]
MDSDKKSHSCQVDWFICQILRHFALPVVTFLGYILAASLHNWAVYGFYPQVTVFNESWWGLWKVCFRNGTSPNAICITYEDAEMLGLSPPDYYHGCRALMVLACLLSIVTIVYRPILQKSCRNGIELMAALTMLSAGIAGGSAVALFWTNTEKLVDKGQLHSYSIGGGVLITMITCCIALISAILPCVSWIYAGFRRTPPEDRHVLGLHSESEL